ncbi:MAG: hypothetical protein QOE13_740 [Gaiellaceae bacterium]|nr:hypothetical protein [Gaiellaceae bacterium]
MDVGRAVRSLAQGRAVGWRAWTVIETSGGFRLASVIYDTVWSPEGPVIAACRAEQSHAAPSPACSCGFHAARDPVDALTYLHGRDEPGTVCRVLGEVLLSGLVVETAAGYRGACAYPLRLYAEDVDVAVALASAYVVPVLSPACVSDSVTSSARASAGSSRSSWNAARTRSSWTAASG